MFGNRLFVLHAAVAAFALASFAVSLALVAVDGSAVGKEERRYASYLLADELRQSSDDLTRMARTYVATGDERYKEYFQDILDIRAGLAPRPIGYHNIYWDLVTATGESPRESGEPAALRTLMLGAGFTDAEIALLEESEDRSNDLAELEVEAMNAMIGIYRDESGDYTAYGSPDRERARDLLHGPEYHEAKGRIMRPLEELVDLLEERTAEDVAVYRERGRSLVVAVCATAALCFLFAALSMATLVRQARADGDSG